MFLVNYVHAATASLQPLVVVSSSVEKAKQFTNNCFAI